MGNALKLAEMPEKDYLKADKTFINNQVSKETRKAYTYDINEFFEFMKRTFKVTHPSQIDLEKAVDYMDWVCQFGGTDGGELKPLTIRRKVSAISSYYNYLMTIRVCSHNPTQLLKLPRKQVVNKTVAPTIDEVEAILNAIDTNKLSGLMHRALIGTFVYTPLRISSVKSLKLKDYTKKRYGQPTIDYTAKGGVFDNMPVIPTLVRYFDEYLDAMAEAERSMNENEFLFRPSKTPVGDIDKAINERSINRIISTYCKKAGTRSFSAHDFRARFLTMIIKTEGMAIAKSFANHSSISTTELYDKRDEIDKMSVIKKII